MTWKRTEKTDEFDALIKKRAESLYASELDCYYYALKRGHKDKTSLALKAIGVDK